MKTTVFCVALESSTSGVVNWHTNDGAADAQYAACVADPVYAADTITRFNYEVDDEADPNQVTGLVDEAMWMVDYKPIKQRVGSDGVLAGENYVAAAL